MLVHIQIPPPVSVIPWEYMIFIVQKPGIVLFALR